ncbi:hypothetical protein QQF64_012057 [Cirrhinus molitorella]|uniref:Uncharacterized protein n=1 Tax=Cirrhinus molitorella TaxID=172907 RepID=A0ABR3LY04_9TELE
MSITTGATGGGTTAKRNFLIGQMSSRKVDQLVKNRSDGLEKLIGKNLRIIKGMKEETIEFICSKVKGLKERVNFIDSRTKKEEINSTEREKRLAHLEAYTRRWNLRIHGIPEKEKKNVRQEVINVAHRLGRANPHNKGRGIIFQFTSRYYRDAVWRAAKDADFHGLQLNKPEKRTKSLFSSVDMHL